MYLSLPSGDVLLELISARSYDASARVTSCFCVGFTAILSRLDGVVWCDVVWPPRFCAVLLVTVECFPRDVLTPSKSGECLILLSFDWFHRLLAVIVVKTMSFFLAVSVHFSATHTVR